MNRLTTAGIIFVIASSIFLLTAFDRVKHPSPQFHFIDLAESWMHGRLDTKTPTMYFAGKNSPPGLNKALQRVRKSGGWNDWASYHIIKLKNGTTVKGVYPFNDLPGDQKYRFRTLDGKWMVINPKFDIANNCGKYKHSRCDNIKYFVSFPPFPAVVFLPFAAIFGYNFNDVIFTALNAGLNVALIFLLLEYLVDIGLTTRTRKENILLAILMGFGTVHYFSAVRGEVWFTALIMGVTLNILYLRFAIGAKHPLWAGLFLALSTATRTPIAFGVVFFLLEVYRVNKSPDNTPENTSNNKWLKQLALFSIPLIITAAILMVYNYVRFDNPLEFGHRYLQAGARPSIRDHGLFSMWFINRNLAAALTHVPVFDSVKPFLHITRHGLSITFLTPAFVLLAWPKFTEADKTKKSIFIALLLASLAIFIPHILYQNTGWAQFGYRFSLDFTPYLIVAFALSGRPIKRGFIILLVWSIAWNLFGAITFGRFNAFYYD